MTRSHAHATAVSLLLVLSALQTRAAAADPQAGLSRFGGEFTGASLSLDQISADGSAVVGSVYSDAAQQGYVWRGGALTLLGIGGARSVVTDVSADGLTVVGEADTPDGEVHAFVWRAGDSADVAGPGGYASATAVSADGSTVVGRAATSDGQIHAFVWSVGGAATDLGTLGGGSSSAVAVSADGLVVVGDSGTADGFESHACVWYRQADGTFAPTDLGTLGGPFSFASGISADGSTVIGQSYTADWQFQPFVWRAGDAALTALAPGSSFSLVSAVSANGLTVTGVSFTSDWQPQAFAWTGGAAVPLTLGGARSFAAAVSANGLTVVGAGDTADGLVRGFAWHPGDVGATPLAPPEGRQHSAAAAVAADGLRIVGSVWEDWTEESGSTDEAVVWDSNVAAELLKDRLVEHGVQIGEGPRLASGSLVAADGRAIAGQTLDTATGQWAGFSAVLPLERPQPEEPTPAGQLQELIAAAGEVSGLGASLRSILENALASLESGDDEAAVHQLEAFQRHVEAQKGKSVPAQTADDLTGAAAEVIALLTL